MHKILNVTNLLGDSLYILKPLDLFLRKFPGEAVALVCDRGFVHEMFRNCFADRIPIYTEETKAKEDFPGTQVLRVSAGQASDIAFVPFQSGKKPLHISEGYAALLGVEVDSIVPLKTWQRADQNNNPYEPCILVAPFSRSCTVHSLGVRNKTLDDWKWEHILRYLAKQGYPIKILGHPNDYLKVSLPLNNYVMDGTLLDLEYLLLSAKLLVSLDNGIGHIAASLDVPTISIWPKISSVDFIAPVFGKNTTFLQINDPTVAPAVIMAGLRHFTRLLLNGDYANEAGQTQKEKVSKILP